MKNNKGFTLVELLAVIILLAVLGGLASIAYSSIVKSGEESLYTAYENTMYSDIMQLLSTHVELIPGNGKTKEFKLSLMISKGYIEPINNPRNKDDLCNSNSSYVKVMRNDSSDGIAHVDSLTYLVCLVCDAYNKDSTQCKLFPEGSGTVLTCPTDVVLRYITSGSVSSGRSCPNGSTLIGGTTSTSSPGTYTIRCKANDGYIFNTGDTCSMSWIAQKRSCSYGCICRCQKGTRNISKSGATSCSSSLCTSACSSACSGGGGMSSSPTMTGCSCTYY